MTFAAFESVVFPFKEKPGLLVVKCVGIPANQLKVPAMMFLVAFRTLELASIVMIPLRSIDAGLDLTVTGQAIVAKSLFAEVMALRTIVDAFQLRMSTRKLPGRSNLRGCRSGDEQAQTDAKHEANKSHQKIQVYPRETDNAT